MRKALRRAGWGLLAAGSLAAAGQAVAQDPQAPAACPSRPSLALGATQERTGPVGEDARAEEVNVELAWLSDPATFSCALAAQVQGSVLLVHGYVPGEAVRRRAVELARAHTNLPIADALEVCSSMPVRMTRDWVEELQRSAAALLTEAFHGQADSFQIQVRADGTVAVAGVVHSREDKLGVSRSLRHLPGCKCVNNQLNVVPGGVACAPPTAGLPLPPSLPAGSGVQPAAYVSSLTPGADSPQIKEGVITFPAEDRPPSAAASYPAATPGVPRAGPPPMTVPGLKRRIELVCGNAVEDVVIVPHSATSVQVRFTLRSHSTGDEVCAKIMAMPEFEGCHISFEIQAAP
jgi:hypothetical protein